MIYLDRFSLPDEFAEADYFDPRTFQDDHKKGRNCYTSKYPFGLFRYRHMPMLSFSEITVLCGDNGSGKSTILNVIAEKTGLHRTTPFNRTDFFADYVSLCRCETNGELPQASSIVTSDDVFEKVLDIRRINDGIDRKREELLQDFLNERHKDEPNSLEGLEDYDRWREAAFKRKRHLTESRYLRSTLMRNMQERSNGESALAFFVDAIQDDALYLLDEPENSLSPANQLQLKYFLEDSARHHGCQFIISTHSPFLLSLQHAKLYDLDQTPPRTCKWTELDSARAYYTLFSECRTEFEQ